MLPRSELTAWQNLTDLATGLKTGVADYCKIRLDLNLWMITDNNFAMKKVRLADKFSLFSDHWNPRIAGELNGQQIKLVKFQGEFVWHLHEDEDEMFLVIKGRFRMDFRDHQEWLEEGEFIIVPRGVEHRPVAEQEVLVMLFEPAGTLNTGNVQNEMTAQQPGKI